MTRISELTPVFVSAIPEQLVDGNLYITIQYGTVVHRCCCGCGSEVVTPLSPTDWRLMYDGETISLEPSIGNWSFACQSHYWITRNHVRWAGRWSREEIAAGRALDRDAKAAYYGSNRPRAEASRQTESVPTSWGARLWLRLKVLLGWDP